MKLLIGTKGVRELKEKFKERIVYNNVIIGEKGRERKVFELVFKDKDILDRTEIDIFNYIKKNCELILVVKFSKGFMDLHKVGDSSEFKEALKILRKKIAPIYIKLGKDKKYWWLGVDDYKGELNIEDMTKEIYRIGLGMNIIPLNLIRR